MYIVHAALGDSERAFDWLERAYEERDALLVHLPFWTFYDPLRSDPRYDALVGKIGFVRRSP